MGVEFNEINAVHGIACPWQISKITTYTKASEVLLHVHCGDESGRTCPRCARVCPVYDRRVRKRRHLDTGTYRTYAVTHLPRVKCADHGVRTITIPWADRGARMPHEFEGMVIDWLQEASVSAVSRLLGLSWTAIDGVMQRAVQRGLARRSTGGFTRIGLDETPYKKGNKYITVVSDTVAGTVLYVSKGRTKESLRRWYDQCSSKQLEQIESVCMDMWPAYINTIKACVPGAEEKIAFDRFHVAKKIGEAVDQIRRQENRELRKEDRDDLVGTKHDWLTNTKEYVASTKKAIPTAKARSLKTARTWAIKELSRKLWHYVSPT